MLFKSLEIELINKLLTDDKFFQLYNMLRNFLTVANVYYMYSILKFRIGQSLQSVEDRDMLSKYNRTKKNKIFLAKGVNTLICTGYRVHTSDI